MLFTDYSFIAFLIVVCILYYTIPKKAQGPFLLLASYIFYASAGVHFILFLISTTVSTYLVSLQIGKWHSTQEAYLLEHKKEMDRAAKKEYKEGIRKHRWRWLLLCLFFNFGVLAVFKYTDFTIANINSIFTLAGNSTQLRFVNFALPMGISFYIFQTMGYIIDVYRGKTAPEKSLWKLALFVSFFPQLIQGPISRFDDLAQSLFEKHQFEVQTVIFGVQRVLWGYFKKLVIADRLLPAVNTIIHGPEEYKGAFVLVGMVYYAAELYADFTGGIDITIGIAQILGIRVAENFNRPYFSKNIAEYWRRWHITMGTWFKDYMFYPISICGPMRNLSKWSRKHMGDFIGKRLPVYISTIFVWFVTGLWHGASWNFIVWGTMNGVVILISQEFSPFYEWFHKKFHLENVFAFRLFQVGRTFLLMCSLRLFDCYRDVSTAFKMFGTMFTTWNWGELFNGSLMNLGITMADYGVAMAGIAALFAVSLMNRKQNVRERLAAKSLGWQLASIYVLLMAILIFGAYGIGYDASQFIYNQF